jgi:two-component system response regulator RpaA
MPQHILVVDDDYTVSKTIERTLVMEGYRVSVAHDGHEALQMARQEPPDLSVLDVVMPGMSGIELCQRLRATPGLSGIPVLFLTAKNEITDKAEGFGAGADDYLTKPFDLREFIMRVRALLRRATANWQGADVGELTVGGLRLDRRKFTVTTPDKTVLLTPVEFDLLSYLMGHPGQVFSPIKLLQTVWGYPPDTGSSDLVRVHIKNIREKIEPNPSDPTFIRTVSHHGYTIEA